MTQTTGNATPILDPSSNKKTGFTGTFYGSVDYQQQVPTHSNYFSYKLLVTEVC